MNKIFTNVKPYFFAFFLSLIALVSIAQNVGINTTGATPNTSAGLDIDFTNKGLLIPRVSLTSTTDVTTINPPVTSMLVYNINASITGAGSDGVGFYYYSGTRWLKLVTHGWLINGNTNTNDPADPVTYGTSTIASNENWMGTTDANDIVFGTNLLERMRIKQTTGNTGIGIAAPLQKLHVNGNSLVNGNVYIRNNTGNNLIGTLHHGANGLLGAATTFAPNGANEGLWIEGSHDGESSGLFLNGNTAVLWSPGDADIFRIYDEDYLGAATPLAVVSNAGNLGVNVASPAERIHVDGNIRASSLAGAGNRLVYSDLNGTLVNLTNGSTGQVLTIAGGIPSWTSTPVAAGNGLSIGASAPVANEVILGGSLEQATTVTQGNYSMTWNLSGTGDHIINNANGSLFQVNNLTEAVVNDASQDYDFRVESGTRTSALHVDAGNNVVRFGSANGSLNQNNTSIAGVTTDYVADFDKGTADGTTIGIGSIELLVDLLSETAINNDFCPTVDITYDLGGTYSWDDIYADDFWNISDMRMKESVTPLRYGLAEIMNLNPIAYKLKNDPFQEPKIGLSAQELLKLSPESVKTHNYKVTDETKPNEYNKVETDPMRINYNSLVPILINAIKEQQALIQKLEERLAKLEGNEPTQTDYTPANTESDVAALKTFPNKIIVKR